MLSVKFWDRNVRSKTKIQVKQIQMFTIITIIMSLLADPWFFICGFWAALESLWFFLRVFCSLSVCSSFWLLISWGFVSGLDFSITLVILVISSRYLTSTVVTVLDLCFDFFYSECEFSILWCWWGSDFHLWYLVPLRRRFCFAFLCFGIYCYNEL